MIAVRRLLSDFCRHSQSMHANSVGWCVFAATSSDACSTPDTLSRHCRTYVATAATVAPTPPLPPLPHLRRLCLLRHTSPAGRGPSHRARALH